MESEKQNKNKIVSSFIWKFGERIVEQFVSFFISILLVRILSPNDFGIIAIVFIFINIANVFINSGFGTALVQNKDANEVDFSTCFYCSLIVSVVIYLILFLFSPFISSFFKISQLAMIIRVFAIKVPLSAFSTIQHAYVERHMIFKKFFFSTLFGTIVSGVVGVYLAYAGYGVWALIYQNLVNTLIDIIVLFFTIPWKPKFTFSKESAKKTINYGAKLLLADLFGTIFDQLKSIIIAKRFSSSDLAFYNRGNEVPSAVNTNITSTIMTVLFPAISNINDDINAVKEMTKKSIKLLSYIVFPLLTIIICISKPLVLVLFTEKWLPAVPFIRIICVMNVIGLSSNVSLQTIKAIGKSDVVLKIEFIKKPVCLLLLILGALFSPLIIVWCMLIYTVYSSIVNCLLLSRLINYSLKEQIIDVLPICFMCCVSTGLSFLISLFKMNSMVMLVIQVVMYLSFYIGLSYVLKIDSFKILLNYVREYRQ